jgi:hypothetical protein
MSEHTEMGPGQASDRDKDSDKDAASTRRDGPRAIDNDPGADLSRERQAEQDSALQQWETEGGADDGTEVKAEGNEAADPGRTADSVQDDAPPDSGHARKEREAN